MHKVILLAIAGIPTIVFLGAIDTAMVDGARAAHARNAAAAAAAPAPTAHVVLPRVEVTGNAQRLPTSVAPSR